jgi:beta-phosphoglucomutase
MKQINLEKENINNKITSDIILFFDMDGTLIDTNYANFLSYKRAILSVTNSNYDLVYNPDIRLNRSHLKNAVSNLSENEYKKIIQEKEKYYNDFLHETKLKTEVTDILTKYSKTNMTVLVTNCRKDRAMATLKYFKLEDKFDAIFCREFPENGKKNNKFQNAISKLGVQPNFVIAFENEEVEIKDAQIAGIPTIINPTHI